MTSPPNIRANVDVKFEDKMASCRAKKGRFISNKEKTCRMARTSLASNLRKTAKETEFAPLTGNNLLDGKSLTENSECAGDNVSTPARL